MSILFTCLALLLVERIPAWRRRRSPLVRRYLVTDLAFLVVSWLALAHVTIAWVGWATRAVHGGGGLTRGLPFVLETVLALVLIDLGNYTAHWLMHRYEVLWRIHAVHHSSPVLDWAATFRSHLLEQLLRRAVAPLLLVVLGVSPVAVLVASMLFLSWGIFNHANLRVELRFLEPLFITPRLHHQHHVAATADRNLGTLFSFWDRLSGRLVTTRVDPETPLGNGDTTYPQTFFALLRAPFTTMRGQRHRAPETYGRGEGDAHVPLRP